MSPSARAVTHAVPLIPKPRRVTVDCFDFGKYSCPVTTTPAVERALTEASAVTRKMTLGICRANPSTEGSGTQSVGERRPGVLQCAFPVSPGVGAGGFKVVGGRNAELIQPA